jgi:hypothetical protein
MLTASQTDPGKVFSPTECAPVLRILEQHRGRDKAIKSAAIGAMTGLSDRYVRMMVKQLVEEGGHPILSSPTKPAGFYLAQTQAEYSQAIASLQGRVKSLCARIDSLVQLQAAV